MLHTQLAALVLAATSLAASGCGGSSKTETTTSTATTAAATGTTAQALPPATPAAIAPGKPLTRAQLIATADAICASANKKVDTVNEVTQSQIEHGFPQAAIYESAETEELAKLVPPAEMAHDWAVIVGDFHRYVDYANAAARYADAKNLKAAIPLFKPAEAIHERLNAIAKRDGFKYCSTTE